MQKLRRDDLWSLEEYAQRRARFRSQVMEHKKARNLQLGPNMRLLFEDRLTMRYQVQEMLHAERIFEAAAVQNELDIYNELIPDGQNFKATMMIEFDDVAERQRALTRLVGIEHKVHLQVSGCAKLYAVADEDLPRSSGDKTSSVHFLRFELTRAMIAALKAGSALSAAVEHVDYAHAVAEFPAQLRASLLADLA